MIAPEIVLVVELFTVSAPFSLIASDVKAPVVTVRLPSGFAPPTAAFKFNLGAGAAVAVIIFIFLLTFSLLFMRYSKKETF